jgi:predicted HTH domain antitoxin
MANGNNNLPPDPSNYDPNNPVNRFSREDAANANTMAQAARSLTEELKDQLGIRSRLNETEKETLNLARQLQRSAQENTVEIGNAGNIERQLAKDRKNNLALQRELRDLTEGMNAASQESLDNADRINRLTEEIQRLEEMRVGRTGAIADRINDAIARREAELNSTELVRDSEAQRIALLRSMTAVSDRLIQQREREAEIQKDINDKMGVTGALVKGTGALMERLGMRSGIFQDAMKESAEEMRRMAEETIRGNAGFTKMDIMLAGFGKLASGFGKALFDPFTVVMSIVDAFLKLNSASTELQQLTGQNAGIQAAHNQRLATGAQVMGVMSEFAKDTGLNTAAIFTPDDLGRMAEATNLLGLSNKEAAQLGMLSKVSGKNFQTSKEEIVAGVNGINAQMGAAVAHGAVMRDVANVSEDIAYSLGGDAGRIAKAAAAARALGLSLQKVNDIADGLLDFESSIGNELEAQLLTGKNINLNKARELALNNDLEGVAKELKNQGISASEFANMNRIQQEGIAKAMGMSRNELGKMVATQAAQGEITAEQAARMQGMTVEQMEQMKATESLKMAFGKIAEPLASILNQLTPIITLLAKGVSFVAPIAPYFFLAYKGVKLLNSGLIGNIKSMGALLTKTKLFGKFYKGGQFMPGGGKAKAGGQRAGGLLSTLFGKKGVDTKKLADSAKGVKPGKGEGMKGFLTGLADGLKRMAGGKVLQGALNLIPASLGLVAMIPGVIGAKLMEIISGPKLLASMQSLALGLTAMGTGKVLLGTLGLLAAAVGFTAMIPASAGMALMGLTAPMASAGIFTLIPALEALGAAMLTGVGALGLAALIGMAVGIGAGFALIGAGALMMGKGIQFAAQGFVSIFGQLGTLVTMLPQLYLLGGALMSIAAGLGAIALTGIAAIPALAALSGFALMAAPLIALGGLFGDGGEDNDGFAKLEAKLDTLIEVISSGGNVYLDSDKIGRTQAKSFSKLTA